MRWIQLSIVGNIISNIIRVIEKITNFSDFFSIATIVIAIVFFYVCHSKVKKIEIDLKYFIKNRDEISGKDIKNLNEIKNKKLFHNNKYLYNMWDRYVSYARNNIVQGRVPDISLYFNRYNLIDQPGRRQIAQIMPGVLTALGILGTFLGLQDGISKLILDNPESIEESIKDLTDGMSLAFISSIVGIISSMVWSYLDRSFYKGYIRTLDEFNLVFNEKFTVFTNEYYLNELFEMQKETTEAVKHIGSDISLHLLEIIENKLLPSIERSMSTVINENVVPNIDHINDTFKNFTNNATDNQMASLNTVINNFNNQLNEVTQASFSELNTTINEFTQWHKETKSSLESLVEGIEKSVKDYIELKNSTESILNSFNQLLDQIYQLDKELNIKIGTINDNTITLHDISTTNVEAVEKIKHIQEQFMKSYTVIEKSINILKEDLETTWQSLNTITVSLNESTSNFSSNLKEGLGTTFDIFDTNLAEISKRLSGTILEIQDTVEQLPSAITLMYNELKSHTVQLSEAVDEINSLYNSINESIIGLREGVVS